MGVAPEYCLGCLQYVIMGLRMQDLTSSAQELVSVPIAPFDIIYQENGKERLAWRWQATSP